MTSLPAPAAQAAQDLRTALRRVRRAPALALAVVLTLALGLGAAATILTLARAALLDPLPFAEAGRLAHVGETPAGAVGRGAGERGPTSYATLLDWRSRGTGFAGLEGYNSENPTVGGAGGAGLDGAQMRRGAQVTAGFFRLLGVRVAAGRDFAAEEEGAAGAGVVIVSDRLARLTAGGGLAAGALSRTITVNGAPRVIVGVLPPAFQFARLGDPDIWTPLAVDAQARVDRSWRWLEVVGRLRPGVALPDARRQLAAATAELAAAHPDALAGRTVGAVPLRDALLGDVKPILLGLLAAVALLLVAVATNLALLMLVRHTERAPELAMRAALGATRGRVLRQLAAESVMLALVGGALAVGVGQAGARGLVAAIPESVRVGMPYLAGAGVDAYVVLMLLGVGTLLVVAFGLGPALLVTQAGENARATAMRLSAPMSARLTASRGDRRLRQGFVAVQVALTVVLLVASGLLVASFGQLVRRDVGFADPAGLATARFTLSGARYETAEAQRQFVDALLARAAALPGVRGAGVVSDVPAGGGGLDLTAFALADQSSAGSAPPQDAPRATLRIVGGDYFRAMGIPLRAGRVAGPEDRATTRPVAVIDARLARRLGGNRAALGGSVIGQRLRLVATGDTAWEVVGVVGDVQQAALDADSPPAVYLSYGQHIDNRLSLVVRGAGAAGEATAGALPTQLRALVRALDPGVPVYAAGTVAGLLGDSRAVVSRRLPMLLCSVFGAAALALSLVAVYAVCARDAQARRREFGIRLAVGGSPAAVRRLLLADGLGVVAVGVAVGALLAVFAARAMRALLFGVGAADWRVYGGVAAGVVAAALLATLRPALRAAATAPSEVLRGN